MRLIDADKLKRKLQARNDNGNEDFDKGYNIGLGTAIDLIDYAPTVEERPQGEWITDNVVEPYGICNQCGVICEIDNYCSNCGADMRSNNNG